jgi:hypothetical protein
MKPLAMADRNATRKIWGWRRIRWFVIGMSVWALVIYLGVTTLATMLGNGFPPREVTNVQKYEQIVQRWEETGMVDHFPSRVPAEARNVQFSFQPGFLQGGAHIQLRYESSPNTIATLESRFSRDAIASFEGGDRSSHRRLNPDISTTRFYTSGSSMRTFPSDYVIIVLLAEPRGNPGHQWNHGRSCGVAISRQRNEIVYWAESW